MKKQLLTILFVSWVCVCALAQKSITPSKVFYHQDFSAGKLPDGWKNVDVHGLGCEWSLTDQPYPGSYYLVSNFCRHS